MNGKSQCPQCSEWFLAKGLSIHIAQKHEGKSNRKNPLAKHSRFRKKQTVGGLRHGSGRGKKGWYLGVSFDSTWELAWLIYQFDHGVCLRRNEKAYTYFFEGKLRKYYPDFILPDGSLVEVKGWIDEQTKIKMSVVSNLVIVGKLEISPFILYAERKFGKEFYTQFCSTLKEKGSKICPKCGISNITKRAHFCQKCWKRKSKIEWPRYTELKDMVSLTTLTEVAYRLGVSIEAVRKHIKRAELG